MPRPAPPSIDEIGLAPVGLANRPAEVLGFGGNQNEMDMVGHQAVTPDFNAYLGGLFGQQIPIDFVIAIFEKRLPHVDYRAG